MATDKKSQHGSKGWTKGKTMSSDEAAYRGADKAFAHRDKASKTNIMPAYVKYLESTATSQKHLDKMMQSSFGPHYAMSSADLASLEKKYQDKYGAKWSTAWTEAGYDVAGKFRASSADAVAQLKEFEDTKRVAASRKGMKGGRFGFDGGYGKGKVRAGVSADMDAKNEEALTNSGLLG